MAGRIRTIKPELLEDEKIADLSDAAWRLFVASWLLADDYGNARAGARYLAANVWQDTGKAEVAKAALAELVRAQRVLVYEVGGEPYLTIPTWKRHQRIDNASKPRVPGPPTNIQEVSRRFAETLGESPRAQAALEKSPLDHRPPTNDLRVEGAADAAAEPTPKVKRKAPEIPIPDDWQPDAGNIATGASLGFSSAWVLAEAAKFRSKALETDRRCVRWDQAFDNWLRKAREFAERDGRVGLPTATAPSPLPAGVRPPGSLTQGLPPKARAAGGTNA